MAEKALIFGGTSGIGKELALLLAQRGMSVTVTGTTRCGFDIPNVRVLSVAAISVTWMPVFVRCTACSNPVRK